MTLAALQAELASVRRRLAQRPTGSIQSLRARQAILLHQILAAKLREGEQ